MDSVQQFFCNSSVILRFFTPKSPNKKIVDIFCTKYYNKPEVYKPEV